MKFIITTILIFSIKLTSIAQVITENWFDNMLAKNTSNTQEAWDKEERIKTFQMLRLSYPSYQNLMEMSWEERDKIWDKTMQPNDYQTLAKRYNEAYQISCKERGIDATMLNTEVADLNPLKKIREVYLNSRKAEYVILTPKEDKRPKINGAAVYGVKQGHELIYRVAVSGNRPMKIRLKGLPSGLKFDKNTNAIRGIIKKSGDYKITIAAKNDLGEDEKSLTIKVGEEIALTPPLGWNSWNSFACDVTSKDIKNTAEQLLKTGLANYGWNYINIDDCWMKRPDLTTMPDGKKKDDRKTYYDKSVDFRVKNNKIRFNENEITGETRDENGNILANKDFTMKPLTDYLHNLGFKVGLYTSPGPLTCQSYEGSYEHEYQDAKQFADWGFDYLKHDWCGYSGIVQKPTLEQAIAPYKLMGDALKKVNRDILYSLCQYGRFEVWKWGESVGGNAWRTTGDIRDNWASMSRIGFSQAGKELYSKPGHWNDPDMLVVGYVGWNKNLRPTYLSPNEQYTHITLWSMLNAPMLIGCDLTKLDDFTLGLLSNNEVIAINQDVLGKQAAQTIKDGDIQIWTKPLSDGSIAVGIFNLGNEPINYQLNLKALKLEGKQQVRDLWRQQNINVAEDAITVKVNRHGTQLYKLSML